ncbi:MAG: hypothetical protein ACE5NJ_02425 [Thermodesulfobacteriota bacterium]
MTDWTMAFRVCAFGFSGVFIALALLMIAPTVSGLNITRLSKGREDK